MRVTVDRDKFQGRALCHMLDPDPFPIGELGYSAPHGTEVEPGDEARARKIVDSCPEHALAVRA